VKLRDEMLAKRGFARLEPVEIEAFAVASARGNVGEAVCLQRLLVEVVIERPVVLAAAGDQLVA
jgi:hypothetical protein